MPCDVCQALGENLFHQGRFLFATVIYANYSRNICCYCITPRLSLTTTAEISKIEGIILWTRKKWKKESFAYTPKSSEWAKNSGAMLRAAGRRATRKERPYQVR